MDCDQCQSAYYQIIQLLIGRVKYYSIISFCCKTAFTVKFTYPCPQVFDFIACVMSFLFPCLALFHPSFHIT